MLPALPVALSLMLAAATAMAAPEVKKSNPRAEARAQAKAEVEKGQLDYELGRFERALEGYSHAYELFPAPALLFNLGQCHRNLKNFERAIFFFEGYLREQTKISQDHRTLTRDLIAECKAELERQNMAAASARLSPPPLQITTPSSPLPPASMTVGPESASRRSLIDGDRSRDDSSTGHRWWFWTAIVGATAIATGAAVYYATGNARIVAPAGSIGTLDRR